MLLPLRPIGAFVAAGLGPGAGPLFGAAAGAETLAGDDGPRFASTRPPATSSASTPVAARLRTSMGDDQSGTFGRQLRRAALGAGSAALAAADERRADSSASVARNRWARL